MSPVAERVKIKLSASQKVEQHIKKAIFQGRLKPRERVIEEDIAKQLGCSRGPVREGLLRLQRDGLIVNVPRRGTFVRDISPQVVDATFRIRAKLEGLCVRYMRESMTREDEAALYERLKEMKAAVAKKDDEAFLQADMALHRTIWRLSRREPLYRSLNSVMNPFIYLVARALTPQIPIAERFKLHEGYVKMILTSPLSRVERDVEKHFSRMLRYHESNRILNPVPNGNWWLGDSDFE